MDIGVCIFATDYAIQIDELARETEARGFESLWVPEHTHIPTSRRSPWAGGAELPKASKRAGGRDSVTSGGDVSGSEPFEIRRAYRGRLHGLERARAQPGPTWISCP